MKSNDVVVCSIGGNDIALYRSLSTIMAILKVMRYSAEDIAQGIPENGFAHLIDLFGRLVREYSEKLVSETKPKMVLVCLSYYPDMNSKAKSWATLSLMALGYNSKPEKLQAVIDYVFIHATSQIKIDGVKIVSVALARFWMAKTPTLTSHELNRLPKEVL